MVCIDTAIDRIDVDAALSRLSEQRRQRVQAMRSGEQRRQSVAAYLLLCRALDEFGCRLAEPPVFEYNEHGKPVLRGCHDVHFSMAHTRGAVAVAVDSSPVGIDIERIDRRVSPALVSYTMSDDEQRQIAEADDSATAFVKLWTRKEALLKLTGEGIQGGLREALANVGDIRFECRMIPPYVVTIARK